MAIVQTSHVTTDEAKRFGVLLSIGRALSTHGYRNRLSRTGYHRRHQFRCRRVDEASEIRFTLLKYIEEIKAAVWVNRFPKIGLSTLLHLASPLL